MCRFKNYLDLKKSSIFDCPFLIPLLCIMNNKKSIIINLLSLTGGISSFQAKKSYLINIKMKTPINL